MLAGSGTAAMAPDEGADALAKIRQDDRQVVDIHLAVAEKIAGGPSHPGRLAKVRQDDRQVVDIDLAVEVGVAHERRESKGTRQPRNCWRRTSRRTTREFAPRR